MTNDERSVENVVVLSSLVHPSPSSPPPPPPANPTLCGLFGIEPNNSLLRIANGRAASAVRAEDRAARGGTRFLLHRQRRSPNTI